MKLNSQNVVFHNSKRAWMSYITNGKNLELKIDTSFKNFSVDHEDVLLDFISSIILSRSIFFLERLLMSQASFTIWDPFSPIMMIGPLTFPLGTVGIIDASITRKFGTPYTCNWELTTARPVELDNSYQ